MTSHYRGKAVKIELQLPGVDELETLLWVPNYDFSWQFHYEYEAPRFLPAGSVILFLASSLGEYGFGNCISDYDSLWLCLGEVIAGVHHFIH